MSENDIKEIYTANSLYTKNFTEPMFLHKGNRQVNLLNLYVTPKYKNHQFDELYNNLFDESYINLEEKLEQFTHSDTKKILLVEGDAGCGKSTLVSWLNYHYAKSDDTWQKICGNRPLITIRLRDLYNNVIIKENSRGLLDAITQYMHLNPAKDIDEFQIMQQELPNALMILDGFDELCMIENISDSAKLVYDFENIDWGGYQFIITSRPNYIIKHNNDIFDYIVITHMDEDKRKEWVDHYTLPNYCGQTLNDDIKKYIIEISDETTSVICDTPMTLYMLAAKDTNINLTKNSWKLYDHIFCELSKTEYNKGYKANFFKHPIDKYRDNIFEITEEIAYDFYSTRNERLYITFDKVQIIIDELSKNGRIKEKEDTKIEKVKALLEQSYALCNYWKSNGNAGAVEFYHNNIRDFFLCEKIYRGLNEIYSQNHSNEEEKQSKIAKLAQFFLKFKKSPLNEMVCRFILWRAENDIQENITNSFVNQEKIQRLLPSLFEELLTNGLLYDNLQEENHIEAIINILSCTAQVYRHIYEPILTKNEYIKWWNDAEKVKQSILIKYCFRLIFKVPFVGKDYSLISSRGDYSNIDLSSCSLEYLDFSCTNLTGTNLSQQNLNWAILRDAILPDGYYSYYQK